jgi:hypothetical protein
VRPATAARAAVPYARLVCGLAISARTAAARAARGRRDHRDAAGLRLLHRLAERLVRSGVDEHVEAGVQAGELVAAVLAEEDGAGQQPPGLAAGRAVADHDQLDVGHPRGLREQVEPLLRGDRADVPDEHLAARSQPAPLWMVRSQRQAVGSPHATPYVRT